jgi:hypothetical protein
VRAPLLLATTAGVDIVRLTLVLYKLLRKSFEALGVTARRGSLEQDCTPELSRIVRSMSLGSA